MQKVEKIKQCLSESFDKASRADKENVKLNVQTLNSKELIKLLQIESFFKVSLEVKRSGTGLVIIFSC